MFRAATALLFATVIGCGGGGGNSSGGGSSSSSGSGSPPVVRTMAFQRQPVGSLAGGQFSTQPALEIRSNGAVDAADNTTVVTVSIVAGTGAGGATLTGTKTAQAAAGVVQFVDLGISLGGTGYQLQFSATGLTTVSSLAFNVVQPPVRALVIGTQPLADQVGTSISTHPDVLVWRDGVTDSTENSVIVTASIVPGTGTSGAVLTGNTMERASFGEAYFRTLGISGAGSGYRLRFTAPGYPEAISDEFSVLAPGTTGISDDSQPGDIVFNINAASGVHAISPFIYGMNGWDPSQPRPKNLGLSRSGGNRMTAYNWETNASNAGSDFQNQNDDFLGGGNTPNGAVAPSIAAARAAGAGIVVTVPLIGYVAADKNGGGDVNQTPNYLATRFKVSRPRKGSAFSLVPDTTDGFVYQDEYFNFLNVTYPGAVGSSTTPIFVSLDNEPDLWHTTHARLRGDAMNPPATQSGTNVGYAELVELTRQYASAIKDVNAAALIFGPVNYGWQGYIRLQNAPDANNVDFLYYYTTQMAALHRPDGLELVDVLDVHWYPEARGACVNPGEQNTCRITTDNVDAGTVAARKQAPRSLWDGSYVETSWITQSSLHNAIQLVPRLKGNFKGGMRRLAMTEYNYGAGGHISGGIAQADVLGIFGRENLFAAALWRLSASNEYIYGAFDMFRNVDGANGSFGDTSVGAGTSDPATTSVYASVDAANQSRMVVVAINKSDAPQTAGMRVSNFSRSSTSAVVRVYTLTSASPIPQRQPDLVGPLRFTMPANSVTTLVFMP